LNVKNSIEQILKKDVKEKRRLKNVDQKVFSSNSAPHTEKKGVIDFCAFGTCQM